MPRRRSPKPQTPAPEMSGAVQQQLYRDAHAIVQGLQSGVAPIDSVPVDKQTNAAYIRAGWNGGQDGGTQFRQNLLQRLGPEAFWDQTHEAFGMKPPPDDQLPELLGLTPSKINPNPMKVTSVRDVQRDDSGRIQRIVDSSSPPQIAPPEPQLALPVPAQDQGYPQ